MARSSRQQDLPLAPCPSGLPLHRWLFAELRRAIVMGRLKPGTRLPSTRELARQQSIARTTVVTVFEQLQAEGYLISRTGSGTVVAGKLPDHFLASAKENVRAESPQAAPRKPPVARQAGRMPPFTVCEPASDLFPVRTWAQLTGRRFKLSGAALLARGELGGYRPLREAVADYVRTARSVHCEVEQVIIVNGTQQALDLVARLVVKPGDAVWMENPGYPGAAGAFRNAGARLVGVPVDGAGFDPEQAIRREPKPVLAYVTPAHQFPLGATLSLERRLKLLAFANRQGCRVFEDDYDGEFRYDVRPLGSLQGHDSGGRVIYAGSFNKLLFSSLRLGYVVLPVDLVEPFLALRDLVGRYPPTLEQAVLADFFHEGHFERHIRRSRAAYRERRDVLVAAAGRHLGGLLEVQPTDAGFHLLGRLVCGLSDTEAQARAAENDVRVTPLSDFYFEAPVRNQLLLGFAASKPGAIIAAVDRLARSLEKPRTSRPR